MNKIIGWYAIATATILLIALSICSKLEAYDENDLLSIVDSTTTQEVVIDKIQLQHADAKDILSILTGNYNGNSVYDNISSGFSSSASYSSRNAMTRAW